MNKCLITTGSCLAVILVAALTPMPAAAQRNMVLRYEYTELASDTGGESRAYAINDIGQAIGWVSVGENRHSAQWHNRVATDLHGTVHFALLHPIFDQDYSESFDISNGGQVVGTARTEIECVGTKILITNAFILRPAVLTDLATPYPGDALTNMFTLGNPCVAHDSACTGISNSNHIVGWADREDGVIHAFLVRPTTDEFYSDADLDLVNDLMVDLGTLASSDPVSSATAANDAGQVTGYSYTLLADGTAAYHAFLVTPNDTDLDGVGDEWFTGAVAGGVNTLMTDLGTLGGTNSWGRDINNNGQVIGESDVIIASGARHTHAFRHSLGQMTDLGTLRDDPTTGFSSAAAINNNGQIVGWAENEDRERRAFIHENGEMQDLNSLLYLVNDDGTTVIPSITLTEARDINADGVIVGWGTVRGSTSNTTRGFLLTPVLVDESLLSDATTGGSTSSSTGTSGDYSSDGVFGNPVTAAGSDQQTPATPTAPLVLCGPASASFMALTLACLFLIRAGGRRW